MLFQRTPLVTALVLAGACSMATAAQADVVRVESGDLTGFVKTVPGTDARVDVFLGVPYAAAPVGKNRWASAKPAAAWRGIRQADTAPQPCKQKGQGSEDCLYVNIYRPAGTAADANLPVAVYAHGGGNTGGNASEHDGARLATENGIIVMTIQYRLGAFGFLKLPGMDSSAGNFGITDTQAALAWVKRNAAAFGGNPDKVTLVTESAGSTNACRILVDPKSKGLVAGVVLQSEDCIHDVDSPKQAKERADKFLVLTGCAGEADPLACLRKLPTDKLPVASAAVGGWNPVSETSAVSEIAKGNWIKVPVLSGSNKEEGRSAGAAYVGWKYPDYKAWVVKLVGEQSAVDALKIYDPKKHEGQYALEYTIGDFITDSGMRGLGGCTNLTLAEAMAKTGALAPWIYTFEDSTVPTSPSRHKGYDNAASHAAELTYLFPDAGQYLPRSVRMTDEQRALARQMRAYWGNFVKHQNPNGEGLPVWKPFEGEGAMMALRLNGKSQTVPASYFADLHHCSFWHSIPVVLDRGDR